MVGVDQNLRDVARLLVRTDEALPMLLSLRDKHEGLPRSDISAESEDFIFSMLDLDLIFYEFDGDRIVVTPYGRTIVDKLRERTRYVI